MEPKVQEAIDFIKWGLKKYKKIGLVSSWGKDSIVLLDLVLSVKPDIEVVFINTPFKPPETLILKNFLVKEWKLNYKEYISEFARDEQFMNDVVLPKGKDPLYKTNPDQCCQIFKVDPLIRAIEELKWDAWFSGLRATESEKRSLFQKVHRQGDFIRLHPLHGWTEADIWRYIACRQLPVHPFYKQGYRSIGCAPCSAIGGKHERDGRWKGTSKQGCGCGIHDTPMR